MRYYEGLSKHRTDHTDRTGLYMGTTTPQWSFFAATPAACAIPTAHKNYTWRRKLPHLI